MKSSPGSYGDTLIIALHVCTPDFAIFFYACERNLSVDIPPHSLANQKRYTIRNGTTRRTRYAASLFLQGVIENLSSRLVLRSDKRGCNNPAPAFALRSCRYSPQVGGGQRAPYEHGKLALRLSTCDLFTRGKIYLRNRCHYKTSYPYRSAQKARQN